MSGERDAFSYGFNIGWTCGGLLHLLLGVGFGVLLAGAFS